MYCPNCGEEISDKAVICVKCSAGVTSGTNNIGNNAGQPPKTWLVHSILVTLLCCLPFGIAGIVNASKVESRFYAGDIEGARKASAEAGKWTKVAFWLGISWILVYGILLALGIAGSFLSFLSLS
jgi:hypothetical protein